MSPARHALRALQHLVPSTDDGVVVLCYHLVGAGTASPVDLPTEMFRGHMEELRESAEVLSLEEAVEAMRTAKTSPDTNAPNKPRVVLTFDDAYANFADVAWPILDALELPVTLFVPVGFLDRETGPPIADPSLRPMSWKALAEMGPSGRLAVGSHTWTHPDLRRLSDHDALAELRRSRQALESRLGVGVRTFCYPRALWSPRLEPLVDEVYSIATIGGGRPLTPRSCNPLRVERVSLRRDSPERLGPMLCSRLWLEEWIGDQIRRRRRR